jgi:predicted Rossmann-fold nucleotide-binding protein
MHREIESLEALRALIDAEGALRDVALQGLDLRGETGRLSTVSVDGALLLGCLLEPTAEQRLREQGALLFPPLPELPYRPYRGRLYTVDELYAGYQPGRPSSLAQSYDQRVYRHYRDRRERAGGPPILEALAQRLHDHAVDDALEELLADDGQGKPRRVVAIMGGHAMSRRDPAYRAVARIGQLLAERGFLMASGGGPGAMEATHLGALLAHRDPSLLDEALALLAPAPSYKDEAWLDCAFAVRERVGDAGAPSLAIPTWFYGHEPPNAFASHLAKYFSNSLREDGLLAIATHGVIYAPGSAGTIQEIFMDAAQNHYGTFEVVSPMVFFGERYWREDKPVYPLLERLAVGRQYADLLSIADDPEAIVAFVSEHPPVEYAG